MQERNTEWRKEEKILYFEMRFETLQNGIRKKSLCYYNRAPMKGLYGIIINYRIMAPKVETRCAKVHQNEFQKKDKEENMEIEQQVRYNARVTFKYNRKVSRKNIERKQ